VEHRTLIATVASAGAAFPVVEALLAARAGPLAPSAALVEVAAVAIALGLAHGLVCAALHGRRAAVVPLALWAMLWGPERARQADVPVTAGFLAPLVVGLAAAAHPGLGALVSLAGAIPVAPSDPGPVPRDAPPGTDLLLVTVDTVRGDADLLQAAGVHTDDGWCVYERAIAAAPWTAPSLHALFLGASVAETGAGVTTSAGLTGRPVGRPTLISRLGADVSAAAFLTNPHLSRSAGFADGFDRWHHDGATREPLLLVDNLIGQRRRWLGMPTRLDRSADERVTAAAIAWLNAPAEGRRFTWVHLMGPHEYRRLGSPTASWTAAYADMVQDAAGRVRRLIATAGSAATIVVTSDHGEWLGEGERWGHGKGLDETLLRVPLAIRAPGVPGQQITGPVALTDLATRLVGAERPPACALPTRDRIPVSGVRGAPGRAAVFRGGAFHAAAPSEGSGPIVEVPGPIVEVDAETRAALEALGYVASRP
jgi:hypothetical protein